MFLRAYTQKLDSGVKPGMENNTNPKSSKTDRSGRRYSTAEQQNILQELESSGLSSPAFCRQRGYCYSTLRHWINRRKKHQTKKATTSFLEVAIRPPVKFSADAMVVELRSGHRIHVQNKAHLSWAQMLMDSAKEESC